MAPVRCQFISIIPIWVYLTPRNGFDILWRICVKDVAALGLWPVPFRTMYWPSVDFSLTELQGTHVRDFLHQNTHVFFQEYAFWNVASEMAAIINILRGSRNTTEIFLRRCVWKYLPKAAMLISAQMSVIICSQITLVFQRRCQPTTWQIS